MVDRWMSGDCCCTTAANSSAVWCSFESKRARRSRRRDDVTRPPCCRTRSNTPSTVVASPDPEITGPTGLLTLAFYVDVQHPGLAPAGEKRDVRRTLPPNRNLFLI